jgi:D-alanine-D-alanine ligase
MAKINLTIEIIRSTIQILSSLGAPSAEGLRVELSKKYKNVTVQTVNTYDDLLKLANRKPDVVFNGIKMIPVDESISYTGQIWVAAFLEKHGIACTGSNAASHELELDKGKSKQRVLEAGLPTSAYIVVPHSNTENDLQHTLNYPLFVKPLDRGGGFGIDSFSVVNTYTELQTKIKSLALCADSDSIVEEFLPGREFSVAILKNTDESYLSMSLELTAPKDSNGNRVLSEKVKSEDSENFKIISSLEIKNKVEDLAVNVFHALGARDYGRIDIRLNEKGDPQFLEANLIPSLLENYGNFPKACMLNQSITYSEMLQRIVDLTLSRRLLTSSEKFFVDDNSFPEPLLTVNA